MDNNEVSMIPYFAHEGEMTRLERVNKRLAWVCAGSWIVSALCVLAYFLK